MGEQVTTSVAAVTPQKVIDAARAADPAASTYAGKVQQAAAAWTVLHPDIIARLPPAEAAGVFLADLGVKPQSGLPFLTAGAAALSVFGGHPSGAAASDAKPQPTSQAGDPVEPFRGELVHTQTDLVVRGAGIDFAFVRTYRNQAVFNGPLGFKWDHAYGTTLKLNDIDARIWTGTMRTESYRRHALWDSAGSSPFNYYVPEDGVHATLEPIGQPSAPTGWARRAPDGTRHIFEPNPSWDGGYRLARIEDRFGNYLAFFYVDALLRKVEVNSAARWVELAYDSMNRIVRLDDHTGRAWTYAYDDHGDLVRVTTPPTPGFPAGTTTSLFYSSSAQNGALDHNLTRIIDAAGRCYLETRYGEGLTDYNRVVWQRVGGGTMRYAYVAVDPVFPGELPIEDRPTLRVRITERNGFETNLVFNGLGGLLRKEECWRGPGGHQHVFWRYRYNRDGSLVASRTPEGVVTHFINGRTHFLRTQPTVDEDALWQSDQLTADVRRGFARVFAEIRRARPLAGSDFEWNERWGDPYEAERDDIIVKHTYEPAYGQPLTTSDPRATASPDPNGIESHDYDRLLTRFEYEGPPGDSTRALRRVIAPTPTRADGTAYGYSVIEEIVERDDRGRVRRLRDKAGTETALEYYSPADGAKEGFLREQVLDAANAIGTVPLAITTRHEVDELGRATATTRPRGVDSADGRFVVRAAYDALDRVVSARGPTPLDSETRTQYEATGQIARTETDWLSPDLVNLGPVVRTFTYDEEHHLTKETIGGGDVAAHLVTRHRYDAAGQLALTLLPAGNDLTFKYDQRDQPVAMTRAHGTSDSATSRTTYDRDGRKITDASPEGRRTTYTVDAFSRAIAVTDNLGNVMRTTFDKAGRAIVTRHFEKRDDGTYWLLARAEIDYDELGRKRREIANRFDVALPATDLGTDFEAAPGPGTRVTTTYELDAAGRVTAVIDPLGNRTATEYDAVGRIAATVDAIANRVELHRDLHGNVIRRDQRDVAHDPVTGAVLGEEILSWTGTYDERDRLTTETDALGNVSTHEYDTLDLRVTSTDALGNVVVTDFDVYGRRVAVTHVRTTTGDGTGGAAAPAITRYEFDKNGNQVGLIDPLGRRTDFRFDRLDRLVERIFPAATSASTDRASIRLYYDRDSLEIRRREAHGAVIITTRDGLGRAIGTDVDLSEVDAGVSIEGTKTIRRSFDGLGRAKHVENETAGTDTIFDSLGRSRTISTTLAGQTLTLIREYDDAGAQSALIYPGGRRVEHDRDALHGLTGLNHVADGIDYPGIIGQVPRPLAKADRIGARVRSIDYGNGTRIAQAFDAGGRLIERHHLGADGGSGRSSLLRLQYLHDGARNPRLRFESGAASAIAERFTYDSEYQVLARRPEPARTAFDPSTIAPATTVPPSIPDVQASIDALLGTPPPTALDDWSYDLAGNRIHEDRPGGGSLTYQPNDLDEYATVDGANRIYDRAGNLLADGVRTYRYDAFHRLVRVLDSGGVTLAAYDYDPAGRRVVERHGADTLIVLHDGPDRAAEYRNGELVAQYVHGDDIDEPLHLAENTSGSGAERWIHTDTVGSVRLLTDAQGVVIATRRYSPFGELESSEGSTYCPLGFTARPLDAIVELCDLRARTYDPRIGRFLQRDPAGYVDGTNLYSYTGNAPLRFTDATGFGRSETKHPWFVDPDAGMWPKWGSPPWYRSAWSFTAGFAKGTGRALKDAGLGAKDAVADTVDLGYRTAREGIHLTYLVATFRPLRAGKELAGDVAAPFVGAYKLGAYAWNNPREALSHISVRNVVEYGLPLLFGGEAGDVAELGRTGQIARETATVGRTTVDAVALDTNALKAAIVDDRAVELLKGRPPVVSFTAAKEFLRGPGRSVDQLREFFGEYGGRMGPRAERSLVESLQEQAAALKRVLHDNDARIAASAMREGLPLITGDIKFSNFLKAIGYKVEGFPP